MEAKLIIRFNYSPWNRILIFGKTCIKIWNTRLLMIRFSLMARQISVMMKINKLVINDSPNKIAIVFTSMNLMVVITNVNRV